MYKNEITDLQSARNTIQELINAIMLDITYSRLYLYNKECYTKIDIAMSSAKQYIEILNNKIDMFKTLQETEINEVKLKYDEPLMIEILKSKGYKIFKEC